MTWFVFQSNVWLDTGVNIERTGLTATMAQYSACQDMKSLVITNLLVKNVQ